MAKKTTAAKKKGHPFSYYTDAADRKRRDFYERLDDDGKKDFVSKHYLAARIMSSGQGAAAPLQVYYANEVLNVNAPNPREHPELAWKLMTVVGQGSRTNHPFLKVPKGRKKDKVKDFLRTIWPHLKDDELDMMISMNSTDEFKDLAEQHGYSKADIKKLFG